MLSGSPFALVWTTWPLPSLAVVLPTGVNATGGIGLVSSPLDRDFAVAVCFAGGGPELGKAKISGP